jgi:uncharacterized protein YbaR (Trm112 family)
LHSAIVENNSKIPLSLENVILPSPDSKPPGTNVTQNNSNIPLSLENVILPSPDSKPPGTNVPQNNSEIPHPTPPETNNVQDPYYKIQINTPEKKYQSAEEKKIDSIFNEICPKCQNRLSLMYKGNLRECSFCRIVYDLLDNFKEFSKDEWIIFSSVTCPYCKNELTIINNNDKVKECVRCYKVFEVGNEGKEWEKDEWLTANGPHLTEEQQRRDDIITGKCPRCKKKLVMEKKGVIRKCGGCRRVYEPMNNFLEYSNEAWEMKEKRRSECIIL